MRLLDIAQLLRGEQSVEQVLVTHAFEQADQPEKQKRRRNDDEGRDREPKREFGGRRPTWGVI